MLSDDEAVVSLARSLRFYGMEKTYYAERHGYNSRLDEVHAAILALKLPRIDGWIERRRDIADRYRRGFARQRRCECRRKTTIAGTSIICSWSKRPATAMPSWRGSKPAA